MIYPFTSPQILTDDIFVEYGGSTGTSVPGQRRAAYYIAERWMSDDIGTLLIPTDVTGTFYYPQTGDSVKLDYSYVWEVKQIRFIDPSERNYYTIAGTANYNAALRNKERGIVDVFAILGYYQQCAGTWPQLPYLVEIVYNTGLPTGTYTAPNMLVALTIAAGIALDEISGFGSEPFQGITEFRNQQYMEKRLAPVMTTFGASSKAQFIRGLIDDLIRLNVVGL